MMNEEEMRQFQTRANIVSGSGMFEGISRDDMIAQTNIKHNAMSFDFDQLNSFKVDVSLLGILAQWPLFNQNPDAVRTMLKTITKGASKKWNNL